MYCVKLRLFFPPQTLAELQVTFVLSSSELEQQRPLQRRHVWLEHCVVQQLYLMKSINSIVVVLLLSSLCLLAANKPTLKRCIPPVCKYCNC